MKTNYLHLLFKTGVIVSMSDGVIHPNEIETLKIMYNQEDDFKNFDFESMFNKYVVEVNEKGRKFFEEYYIEIENSTLSEQEQLKIIRFALNIIKSDNEIQYSEIKFFKSIRYRLKITDEIIIASLTEEFPDIDLFLGGDIHTSLETATRNYFDNYDQIKFEEIVIKSTTTNGQ